MPPLVRIQQSASQEEKQALLQQIQSGSATAWRHVHFSGYYDYSDENLSDSFDLCIFRSKVNTHYAAK